MKKYYFDSAASMPTFEQAQLNALSRCGSGNPSSPHSDGAYARSILNTTRQQIADYIGCDDPRQLYFTSGATEAANLIIQGYLTRLKNNNSQRNEIIVSSIEHPAVYQTVYAMQQHGFIVHELPVDNDGCVEPMSVKRLLSAQTAMVCVMSVNNETGSIQPINQLAYLVKETDPAILFLSDVVQHFAKLDWNIDLEVVDALFMSGHKIGADKGVGCFYLNKRFSLQPLFYGGEQECAYRPGTENVFGIGLLGEALRENLNNFDERFAYIQNLNKRLMSNLSKANLSFKRLVTAEKTSPYILALAFPTISSTIMLEDLNASGFCLSRGSACSSHTRTPSRIFSAMNVPVALINCTIRISFSMENTEAEVDELSQCIISICSVE